MRKIFTICLLAIASFAHAQFRVDLGASFSNIRKMQHIGASKIMTSPAFSIGLDYLKKDRTFLSSNLGYMEHGGNYSIYNTDGYGNSTGTSTQRISFPAVYLNTIANYKITKKGVIPFIFLGPRLNYFIDDVTESPMYSEYNLEIGGSVGFGVYKDGFLAPGIKFEYIISSFKGNQFAATAFIRFKK